MEAVDKSHYTLYLPKECSPSLLRLDGDALGESLIPIFQDAANREIASLFPRIASRLCGPAG